MSEDRYTKIRTMVEQSYALSGEGNWDAIKEMMTDDFYIIEAASLPYAGRYEGKDALQNLYSKVFQFWSDPQVECHDITVGENCAVAVLTLHVTSQYNGERLALRLCETFHLRGDKISSIEPFYFDTALIAKATGVLANV